MKWIRDLRRILEPLVQRRRSIRLELPATSNEPPVTLGHHPGCDPRRLSYRPYHLNAPGPFYSVNEGCITCLAPHSAAPEVMGFYEDPSGRNARSHCFFKKQPQTAEEVDQAINAMAVSCVENLRYGGSDPVILKRLCEMGYRRLCDDFEGDQAP